MLEAIEMLDIRTLMILFIVTNLLVGCLMLAAFHGRHERSINIWAGSLFIQAGGWLLMGRCNSTLPLYGFAILSLSHALMLSALCSHFRVSQRYGWPFWLVLPAVVLVLVSPESRMVRQLAGNSIAAMQILVAACLVLTRTDSARLLRGIMGVSGLIGAMLLAMRAEDVYVHGANHCLADTANPLQVVSYLCFFIFRISFIFGFVLLIEGRQREAMTRLARLDSLTELYNRRTFIELAERELIRCQRMQRGMALLMIDLDNFKRINDSHGHVVGDQALCHVKSVVEACLRGGDIFARYGGEEFVVLLPETNDEGASSLAERLRLSIANHPVAGSIPVTASIGIASVSVVTPDCTLDSLLARADRALYAAKAGGRNQLAIADDDLVLAT